MKHTSLRSAEEDLLVRPQVNLVLLTPQVDFRATPTRTAVPRWTRTNRVSSSEAGPPSLLHTFGSYSRVYKRKIRKLPLNYLHPR